VWLCGCGGGSSTPAEDSSNRPADNKPALAKSGDPTAVRILNLFATPIEELSCIRWDKVRNQPLFEKGVASKLSSQAMIVGVDGDAFEKKGSEKLLKDASKLNGISSTYHIRLSAMIIYIVIELRDNAAVAEFEAHMELLRNTKLSRGEFSCYVSDQADCQALRLDRLVFTALAAFENSNNAAYEVIGGAFDKAAAASRDRLVGLVGEVPVGACAWLAYVKRQASPFYQPRTDWPGNVGIGALELGNKWKVTMAIEDDASTPQSDDSKLAAVADALLKSRMTGEPKTKVVRKDNLIRLSAEIPVEIARPGSRKMAGDHEKLLPDGMDIWTRTN
jgi:hypothetical protein